MAWTAEHVGLLREYWRAGGIKDFGDPTVNNSFCKRVGEMMGEEIAGADWTDEMSKGVVDFVNAFYSFPDGLTITGTTFTGLPKYKNNGVAVRVKKATEKLKLRTYGFGKTRLQVLLSGGRYAGNDGDKERKADEAIVRAFMRSWLLRGFVPVANTADYRMESKTEKEMLDRLATLPGDCKAKDYAALITAGWGTTGAATLGWRGDTRQWGDVKKAQGLHSKVLAIDKKYLASTNLLAPWHVFHDEEYRNRMYYRRYQADNCLDTCVSISLVGHANNPNQDEFKTNVTFPQLHLIEDKWRKKLAVKYKRQADNQDETKSLFVDRVRLYLVRLPQGTHFFDTYGVQALWPTNPFPECAVRGIPLRDVLGYVTFVRVHHGKGDNMGEAFDAIPIVHDDHSKLITDEDGAGTLFNLAVGRFSRGWTATGSAEKTPLARTFTKVGNLDVVDGKLSDMPGGLG